MKLSEHTILAGKVQQGHKSSAMDKIQFLRQHENLWEGCYTRDFPGLKKLAIIMQNAGYYSPSTYILDIQLSVFKHIDWLRKLRSEGKLPK